jgi:four helix bundle protein
MAFKFEKLKVWEKAVDLSAEISDLVKTFPKDELYVLSSQLKRASDSISLNIAEGSTGQSNLEFKKFLGYALRSAIEVVGCFHLAKRRNLIDQKAFDFFYDKLTELIKGIQALRNSIKTTT